MEGSQLFCSDCFGAMYGATCYGCGQKIGGDELWIEALQQQWHSRCFVCEVGAFLATFHLPPHTCVRTHTHTHTHTPLSQGHSGLYK